MSEKTILVVDDESTQRQTLAGYLRKQGFKVETASNGIQALDLARKQTIELILSDMRMPEMNGLELIREIQNVNPDIAMVVLTAFGSVEDAVEAMKSGAVDYLQKPIDLDQLDLIVARVLERKQLIRENKRLKITLENRSKFSQLITASPQMEEVLSLAIRAAQSKATILIRGESGTGKEMLARGIHWASPRQEQPFVAMNIAALSENLVESELFGHEKGAFTGASALRKGRFEVADGGTLFIDEIAEIPPAMQVKLLRVLQEKEFERVGGMRKINADVRVIAATHQNLEERIQSGQFREDLFYRLNVVCIRIPPLRDRKKEIPVLIDHFIRKYCEEEDKPILSVTHEAMDVIMKYPFPGNVRELENTIQRAVVLARDDVLGVENLAPQIRGGMEQTAMGLSGSLPDQVAGLEKNLILKSLEQSGGNQSEAARRLGITERHFRYKLKKYDLK